MNAYYLGIDMGSVSTNLVLMNPDKTVAHKLYLRSKGRPVDSLAAGFCQLTQQVGPYTVLGAGVTGSGRKLIGSLIGADIVKNEITAHALAAVTQEPEARTVLEIGGQDSKMIWIQNGVVQDFAMNTVCAAGTGSFLDRQAARLGIGIEELAGLAAASQHPQRIAGRCAVFAESDMIHKQQEGAATADILWGLCKALVQNFLNNLAKGHAVKGPVLFQGGVAANGAMLRAFQEELQIPVKVPRYYDVMGAWGAAILAQEAFAEQEGQTKFHGLDAEGPGVIESFICTDCSNACQIIRTRGAVWGSRCGKY